MEAATVLRSPISLAAAASHKPVLRPTNGVVFGRLSSNYRLTNKLVTAPHVKTGVKKMFAGSRKSFVIRASASQDGAEAAPIAPLKLESPVGQFLSQILASHPHLVPAAVDQQLEQLQTETEAEKKKDEPSVSGTDLVLYRRIAEVKANERRRSLQEILYTLVVQKFVDANIPLIPSVSSSSSDITGRVDTWPSQDEKLKRVHSHEAYEMIQNHLALILGNRIHDTTSVAQLSKLRVGQVYAASIMYGYFLKRVDERFQLEKAMKILPEPTDRENEVVEKGAADDSASYAKAQSHPEVSSWAGGVSPVGFGASVKPSRLRSYVMEFDAETLARYATCRSKETVTIAEKHTEALFGRPEIVITPQGTVDSSRDELIKIGFSGLKRLVLEAVTFGSFLWEVESHVESRCHWLLN